MGILRRIADYFRRPAGEHPDWQQRYFESAETNRLNSAQWEKADDVTVNHWLATQLSTVRARSIYESRNNGIVGGVVNTFADDVVGQDGPSLQVQSDSDQYDRALEQLWKEWFAAPTTRNNVSGAALLKLWVRNLWKCGEFLAQIVTDDQADEPLKMRLRPIHPRRLVTPPEKMGDPLTVLGISFDRSDRPARYYVSDEVISGLYAAFGTSYTTLAPDDVIHEFVLDEEGQARGIPWLNPSLQPASDLRAYDAQVQDAARQIADQSGLLYTDHQDAQLWTNPESIDVERRVIRMAPPGWKPFIYPATQPPVQYPDYRAERQREIGRPVGMPLLMIRLDASKHNYSSARLDTQVYRRSVGGIQIWLSGSDKSCGTLNRLVDLIAAEARFTVPALRKRPPTVAYRWTWPAMPHVDPSKEASAEATALSNQTMSLSESLAARGAGNTETLVASLVRDRKAFEDAGLPLPPWMTGSLPTQINISRDETPEEAESAEDADVEA